MVYFTADYHLNHFNIIRYCKRPFTTIEEMDETLIKNHNNTVKPEDTVFFVGDFAFGKITELLPKFNGRFIFLKGNHDKKIGLPYAMKSCVLAARGKDVYVTHNPNKLPYGFDFYICGHVHELWKFKTIKIPGKKSIDVVNVGVDVWNFQPITMETIMKHYHAWKRGVTL